MNDKNIDKGYVCEHCGSYVKRYRRSFNSNMAMCLWLLYKFNVKGFIKVEEFLIANGRKRCGDFSYLVHYRFLEKQSGKREDGSPRNGYYRLTSLGILFVEGKIKAHEKFYILHNQFMGFDGKEITLKEALGEKFNYDELMQKAKTDKEVKEIQALKLFQ